jgi:hypothetical protein
MDSKDSYYYVGENVTFRIGGDINSKVEFIHSKGLGYDTIEHSITSLYEYNNTRVFWVRV